jgi:hypothetical protein
MYLIGMNYGDNFPRMVSTQKDKIGYQGIIVSTRYSDKIYVTEHSHWKMQLVPNET